MGRDRVRRARVDLALSERARWLSAVLIVTAIAGISVAVRVWPVDVRRAPDGPASVLASRALPLIAPPRLPRAASASALAVAPVAAPSRAASPPVQALPEVAAVVTPDPQVTAVAAPVADDADVVPQPAPLLAARRTALPLVPPAMAAPPPIAIGEPPPAAGHGLVEIPAVVVTRAVSVAGRGILTGLRATTAVVRAAF